MINCKVDRLSYNDNCAQMENLKTRLEENLVMWLLRVSADVIALCLPIFLPTYLSFSIFINNRLK